MQRAEEITNAIFLETKLSFKEFCSFKLNMVYERKGDQACTSQAPPLLDNSSHNK